MIEQIVSIDKLRSKYAPMQHSVSKNGQKLNPIEYLTALKQAKTQQKHISKIRASKSKIVGKIQIKGQFKDPIRSIDVLHQINNQPLEIPKPKTKKQLKAEEDHLNHICNVHMLRILKELYMKVIPSKEILHKMYILSNWELFIKMTFGSCPLSKLMVANPEYLIEQFQRAFKSTSNKDLKDFAERPKPN